jgi:hypothetical protein
MKLKTAAAKKTILFTMAILIAAATSPLPDAGASLNTQIQIFSLGTIALQPPATPPLRIVDFETGDFSQVAPGDTNGGPLIVSDVVHSGVYAVMCPITNASVSVDSEVRMWGINATAEPLYYSFWVYVEEGYEVVGGADTWNVICEWNAPHPVGGGMHVDISMMTNWRTGIKNQLYMNFQNLSSWGIPGTDPQYPNVIIWSNVSMPTGQWVHFQTYYQTDMTNGTIRVDMDGQTIIEWKGRTQFDDIGSNLIAWCLTNYCGTGAPPHTFWFDDICIDRVPH